MIFKKGQLAIFIVTLAYLIAFTFVFWQKRNYEFLAYVGVVLFFLILILATNKKVSYPNWTIWGLSFWGLMHMCGGGVYINGIRLYDIILLPLSNSLPILRYDQLVHIIGFGVATLVMYAVLKPLLKDNMKKFSAFSIILVMAGLGVGALNEIIEFVASLVIANTGVGDAMNTGLDLISDFIGALIALAIIRVNWKK